MHREAIRKWLTRSRQVNRCNCITAMDQTQAINFEVKKVGTAIPLSGTWPRPRLLGGCQWDYEPEAFQGMPSQLPWDPGSASRCHWQWALPSKGQPGSLRLSASRPTSAGDRPAARPPTRPGPSGQLAP